MTTNEFELVMRSNDVDARHGAIFLKAVLFDRSLRVRERSIGRGDPVS